MGLFFSHVCNIMANSVPIQQASTFLNRGVLLDAWNAGTLLESRQQLDQETQMRAGMTVDDNKLRLYVPERDGSASINLNVWEDDAINVVNPLFSVNKDIVKMNSIRTIVLNGKQVPVSAITDMNPINAMVKVHPKQDHETIFPVMTLNPADRYVGINTSQPQGELHVRSMTDSSGELLVQTPTGTRNASVNFNMYHTSPNKYATTKDVGYRVHSSGAALSFDTMNNTMSEPEPMMKMDLHGNVDMMNGAFRFSKQHTNHASINKGEFVNNDDGFFVVGSGQHKTLGIEDDLVVANNTRTGGNTYVSKGLGIHVNAAANAANAMSGLQVGGNTYMTKELNVGRNGTLKVNLPEKLSTFTGPVRTGGNSIRVGAGTGTGTGTSSTSSTSDTPSSGKHMIVEGNAMFRGPMAIHAKKMIVCDKNGEDCITLV